MNTALWLLLSTGLGGAALFAAGYFLGWKRQTKLIQDLRSELESQRRRADAKEAEVRVYTAPARDDSELDSVVRAHTKD